MGGNLNASHPLLRQESPNGCLLFVKMILKILGVIFSKSPNTTIGEGECEIHFVKEFVSGGKTLEEWRQLADILPMMQKQGLVQPFNRPSHKSTKRRVELESPIDRDTALIRPRELRRP